MGRPATASLGEARIRPINSSTVTIRATGTLPNLQTEAQLVMSPIEIFPPEFILFFVEPPITNPATLPFDVQTTFSTTQVITEVSVHDADGRHEVPVIRL
jgi:hypothetical protein